MSRMDMIVFDSIAQSNIPYREKSMIRQWADRMTGGGATKALHAANRTIGSSHVSAGLDAFRQGSESGLTAILLAKANAHGMLDTKHGPVDGILGGVLIGAGVVGANYDASKDLRNIGNAAFTVWTFRKMSKIFGGKSGIHGDSWEGEDTSSVGADPIIEAAREL